MAGASKSDSNCGSRRFLASHIAIRLRYLLGPVLCRSAEEQETFGRIIGFWFPQKPDLEGEPAEVNGKDDKEWQSLVNARRAFEDEAARRLRARRMREMRRQLRVFVPILVILFILSLGIQYALVKFAPQQMQAPDSVNLTVPKAPGQSGAVGRGITAEPSSSFGSKLPPVVEWLASVSRTLGPFTTLLLTRIT
jgi:hypothetical protein